MRRLIIHPKDPSTEFLSPIYRRGDTVVREHVERHELENMIRDHDHTVMMGHGSPWGLLGVGVYRRAYAVDGFFAEALSETKAAYIWCHASKFVERYQLSGFSTGMFISEDWEATVERVAATPWEIDESNEIFAEIVGRHADPLQMYMAAYTKYGKLAEENEVAAYNHQRLRYYPGPQKELKAGHGETLFERFTSRFRRARRPV